MICTLNFYPFAAWQACRDNPNLQHLPFVVAIADKVSYVSTGAKEAGIQIGMGLLAARARVTSLTELESDSPQLQDAWHDLLLQLYGLSPKLESEMMGTVSLECELEDAQNLAQGFGIRTGFAETKELASLAAMSGTVGSVRTIKTVKHFLEQIPLYIFKGLGLSAKLIEKFYFLGVKHLGQLFRWSKAQLKAFAGKEAQVLLPYLYGHKARQLSRFNPPKNLSASYNFEDAAYEPYQLEPVIVHLGNKLVSDMGGYVAKRLRLIATVSGINFSSVRMPKQPLREIGEIRQQALVALEESGASSLGVDSIKLELLGLYQPSEQPTLWRQKENRLKAIELVEQRFPNSLLSFKEHDPYSLISENNYQLRSIVNKDIIAQGITDLPKDVEVVYETLESTDQRDAGEWQTQAA